MYLIPDKKIILELEEKKVESHELLLARHIAGGQVHKKHSINVRNCYWHCYENGYLDIHKRTHGPTSKDCAR